MGKRYAIAIGINDYFNLTELSFCVKDSVDFTNTMVDFCNVKKENIRIITSEKTKPNANPWLTFCEVIKSLLDEFQQKEDDIFFYFSGHGQLADETTVIFKNEKITLTEINEKIEELNPKTKIIIFDSCFSGSGYAEKNKSAQFFNQSSNQTSGYYILCSCSAYQTAKESSELSNGRFTHFLISVIKDLQNYDHYNLLDVNSLFSKVDLFFRENPLFKQSPFQQIRSIGSYPIANSLDSDLFYSRINVKDSLQFDWLDFVQTLNLYLNTKADLIGEFTRLVREHCDNVTSMSKGNAQYLTIEISKHKVVLTDKGSYFDLFNPPEKTKAGGGIETAREFRELFLDFYEYSTIIRDGINYYSFEFIDLDLNELCVLNIDFATLSRIKNRKIKIDEACNDYTIIFGRYAMLRSGIPIAIKDLASESERTGKIIYLKFHEEDRIIEHVKRNISFHKAIDFIKIKTYSD